MTARKPRPADAFYDRRRRRNVRVLIKYMAVIATVVAVYAVLFHVVMWQEGQRHSWITGLYWTLSTMTTLGLGDVVFASDLGKLFTTLVLATGILMVFVVLPFAFIRFFYAPWLEDRPVPERIAGHVVIARWDNIAPGLVEQLELRGIPYYVLASDSELGARLDDEGVAVAAGAVDDRTTYERLRTRSAGMVLANADDTTNTNITLTVREAAPTVPITAIVENEASIDILELAGATKVLPLKHQLGEQLANRLNAGHAQTHVIGSFRELLIAEFPVHNTPFADRTLEEIKLREHLGVNIVGVFEHARFHPAGPHTRLSESSLPVVVGTEKEIAALNEVLVIYDANYSPVVVIGGGKVGQAAVRFLKKKNVPVHLIEKDERFGERIASLPDRLFMGDAAEREVLMAAGLEETPGVLLTTNDDAMNIYLAVYCRRLAPEVRIVSRITHDRNMEAIRRAGADLALSHTSLGVESVIAALRKRDLVFLGEGIELYELPLPASLVGESLGTSAIATRTGLNVIAIQERGHLTTNPTATTTLTEGSQLLMIGSQAHLRAFQEAYR